MTEKPPKQPIDQRIVFALSTANNKPVVIMGVPTKAWEYMQDGKTHTFDLTNAGLPIQLVLFGAESHDEAMRVMNAAIAAQGKAYVDARREDFGMKPAEGMFE